MSSYFAKGFIFLFVLSVTLSMNIPIGQASPNLINDVLVYGGPGPQNEVSIAVNPQNPNNIVVGFNDLTPGISSFAACSYAYSIDGGATWTYGGPLPQGNLNGAPFCDPWLAFDNQGYCYYVGMTNTSRHEIFISVAAPDVNGNAGPSGFSTPQLIAPDDKFNDKPAIAVDTTGGPYDGYIYVVWSRSPGTPSQDGFEIWYRRGKRNPGTTTITWDGALTVSPAGQFCQLAQVAVGPAPYSDVYIVYQRQTYPSLSTANAILLSRLFSGGQYFWGSDIGILVANVTPVDFYMDPASWARHSCSPTLGVDQNETIYVAWADKRFGDDDILLTKSTDLGTTWDASVRINQDPVGNGKDQWHPALVLNEGLGALDIAFYDRRNDPNNNLTMFYLARSYDGGVTFSEFPISDTATDPSAFPHWPSGSLGDYVGIDSVGNATFVCWGDGRNANVNPLDFNSDVYFEKFVTLTRRPRPLLASNLRRLSAYFTEISEPRSVEFNITILSVDGFSDMIELSVEGVPLGAYYYFDPSSGIPPFETVLTIVLEYAQEGVYDFNVSAIFCSETLRLPFKLDITSSPYITLEALIANPGDNVALQGYGFTANASYNTYLNGQLLKTGEVGADGMISTNIEIPTDIQDGVHTVLVEDEAGIQASTTFSTPRQEVEEEEGGPFEVPAIISCDELGNNKTTFLTFEDVYVKGNGYPANVEVTIYILPDGCEVNPSNAKTSANKTTGNDGTLNVTLICRHPLEVGTYDIWVDVNQNGIFDSGDVLNNQAIGIFAFNVIPEPQIVISILLMLGALAIFYVKKSNFHPKIPRI